MAIETIPGTKEVGQRMAQAEISFVEMVQEMLGCSQEDAYKVFDRYLKERIIKRDLAMGRYNVKHGVFLEPDVMRNAIAQAS
jgi:hypothetical protein